MLDNPEWYTQTKTEPFTRAHVIAWLETKPAKATYCYVDNGSCMVAQYLKHMGHHEVEVGPHEYSTSTISNRRMPDWLIVVARDYPHTLGGALERARAAID